MTIPTPSVRPEPEHAYCTWCGRELVDVHERGSLYDMTTGERIAETWRQCPKYPRNSFMALFAGPHESHQRGSLIRRSWR